MAHSPSKRSASGAVTAAFKEIAARPSQLCCLCLVIPQVWLWILLRAVGSVPSATTLGFYAAEGAALLAMALFFCAAPCERRFSPAASLAFALCMACAPVAARYGLAKREQETMALIAKGRSKRYIAEQLCLSENTVRGYAKTLYAKLDVHSRQELLDLLGVE